MRLQKYYSTAMSTPTTIRLDDELKARLAAAAERASKTPHAFIVDAVAGAVEQSELQADFYRVAADRLAEMLATDEGVPLDEAIAYMRARIRGKNPSEPKPRKIR